MSHLEAAKSVPLLVTRGKSAMFRVEPLPDEPEPSQIDQLRAEWMTATPQRQAEIEAEVARIEAEGWRREPRQPGLRGERVDSTFLKGALQLLTLVAVPMLLLAVVLVLAWVTR